MSQLFLIANRKKWNSIRMYDMTFLDPLQYLQLKDFLLRNN